MITFFFRLVAIVSLCGTSLVAQQTVLLEDGFESKSRFAFSKTPQGRAKVTGKFSPASGRRHLVLDDSKDDAVFSSAEATATLDLTLKRNVILQFKAKSLGNDPHPPPNSTFTDDRNYDGVAVSADGGTTWKAVASLSSLDDTWTSFGLPLDSVITSLNGFGPRFKIRFSCYGNAPAGIDGVAIDDVSVTAVPDQRAMVDLPSGLSEGTGPYTGHVTLHFAPSRPLVLELSSSPAGALTLPPTVTVPAGKTSAPFEFNVADDSLVTLARSISVSATATLVTSIPTTITVFDNDTLVPSFKTPPQVAEGATPSNNGLLCLDKASEVGLTFSLVADPEGELSIPSSVTIPAGSTQVAFTVRAVDDSRLDGPIPVTLTATAPGVEPATGIIMAVDNDLKVVALSLPYLVEGGIGNGSVSISGPLGNALAVSLTSAGGSGLEFPATVTIPAGQTQVSFKVTATDNDLKDGTRSAGVIAAAPPFATVTTYVTIRDNDVATYWFTQLADVLNVSSPVAVTVTARDIEGRLVVPVGAVNLDLVYPDGTSLPLNPASVPLTSTEGWTGNVTVPAGMASPARIRASDGLGNEGTSTPFESLRSLNLATSDLLWDAGRGRIYASVPAAATGSIHANMVVAIDPSTLEVTGSVFTGQDPDQLAMTGGGEYLYVALNGNGTVARIDLGTMSVASTFAVGTSPTHGTLYVSDMCTVAGQPDVLVISQYRKNSSPRHDGVAVYDNGVMRPVKTLDRSRNDVIEPSADPSVFFGFNNSSTEFGFHRLKLGPTGMTELEVEGGLFSGFSTDIRSAGDTVYSTGGGIVDGAKSMRTGSFGTNGLVCPDGPSNRVYYLEGHTISASNSLAAFDPVALGLIRRLTLPSGLDSAGSLIRWGVNGLAFRTPSAIHVTSSSLVPGGAPADLVLSVETSPSPAIAGAPLVYTLKVENGGPNPSKGTALGVRLSQGQVFQSATASTGTPVASGLMVNWPLGELAAGASAMLTLTTRPDLAGSLSFAASATSDSIDTDLTNNTVAKVLSVGFNSGPDTVNTLRLTANNLVWDSSRKLLWATVPGTVEAPLGKSVVSIDPQTGLVSDPLPIGATPLPNSMAISANNRYLYIGLSDVSEVHRLDLSATPPAGERIELGASEGGRPNFAQDLEVLPGNGTSFIMVGADDHSAAIYDGMVRRSKRTDLNSVGRIEAGPLPNVFIGYNNFTSGFGLSRITASAQGAVISKEVFNVVTGYNLDFEAEGDLMLSSSGVVANSKKLVFRGNLGVVGRPCVDAANGRLYLVHGNGLRAYNAKTLASTGIFALPVIATGDWALLCRRWGEDGFAIVGRDDDKIHIARWSAAIPGRSAAPAARVSSKSAALSSGSGSVPDTDDDSDGMPNALEYLFGSNPAAAEPGSPLKTELVSENGRRSFRLTFPRREGVGSERYRFEYSIDLSRWSEATSVRERVISSAVVDGVAIQNVEATIPLPPAGAGFVRLVWIES